jgi:hypothetical protein
MSHIRISRQLPACVAIDKATQVPRRPFPPERISVASVGPASAATSAIIIPTFFNDSSSQPRLLLVPSLLDHLGGFGSACSTPST